MKKLVALLLSAAIIAGLCCYEVSAVPDPDYIELSTDSYSWANDKIYELNHYYTNAQDDEELIVSVYFNAELFNQTVLSLSEQRFLSFRRGEHCSPAG